MKRIIWFFCVLIVLAAPSKTHADFFKRYEQLASQDLPEFSFSDKNGYPVTLETYKGRVIILNIWSITCGPCVAEMPSLDELAGNFPEDKLLVITLNVDPIQKKGLEAFYDQNGYRYLSIFQDPMRKSQEALKWQALPTTLIINKEGKLVGRKIGATKWDAPEVIEIFEQLVEGKNPEKPQPSFTDKLKGWFGS